MCKIQTRVAPESQLTTSGEKCISCQKALAWSIGGSKGDLLEPKVAVWTVETSGLENEVQCILHAQQMHELRPFPTLTITKYSKTAFLLGVKWAPVGRGAAPCHWHWHKEPAMGELAGWTAPESASSSSKARPQNQRRPPDTNHDRGVQSCQRR
jgi:hypothetical protein